MIKKAIHYRLQVFCYAALCFLSSCALKSNDALTSMQIQDLVRQNLVLVPDNNFDYLPSSLKENEIIFLGETHDVKPLINTANQLAVYLASFKPVVYADESLYGLGPFWEAASLGNPKKAMPIKLPENIQKFNATQSEDKKILMTAIDMEHSIYHTKQYTVLFLQELASRSTSKSSFEEINKEIVLLPEQDSYDKMNTYLDKLAELFIKNLGTFSTENKEEILFSMELLKASNRCQYIVRKIKKSWENPDDIRYKYFSKTIERAYQKAQKRNAILLCRVGYWHISSDNKCEAKYFANDYPLTKGKVATIRLVPLYYNGKETNDVLTNKQKSVNSIVKVLMKDCQYSYISLSELQKEDCNICKVSNYYYSKGPKYDGLLFVRIDKSSKDQLAK